MNGCISFRSIFHMFIMQAFHFSFCFKEIRSLIHWLLSTFFIQLEYPTFLVTSSFLFCCNMGVIFQCKFVLSTPIQNGVVPTMGGLASFLQILFGFVVHSLPLGSSTFGTTGEVLLDDVTGD